MSEQTPADIYTAAAIADHLAHCTPCRERAEQAEARYAAYGASLARRDRRQLGLRLPERASAVNG